MGKLLEKYTRPAKTVEFKLHCNFLKYRNTILLLIIIFTTDILPCVIILLQSYRNHNNLFINTDFSLK